MPSELPACRSPHRQMATTKARLQRIHAVCVCAFSCMWPHDGDSNASYGCGLCSIGTGAASAASAGTPPTAVTPHPSRRRPGAGAHVGAAPQSPAPSNREDEQKWCAQRRRSASERALQAARSQRRFSFGRNCAPRNFPLFSSLNPGPF